MLPPLLVISVIVLASETGESQPLVRLSTLPLVFRTYYLDV